MSQHPAEQRSGGHSRDPTFDPGELFDVIEREESAERVLAARETPLRHLVLCGVLLAFYGAGAVCREEDARRDRAAQRHQSHQQ